MIKPELSNGIDETARDQKHRQTLPVKSSTTDSAVILRLTQSQNYGKKSRKKYKSTLPPPIPENGKIEEENEEEEEEKPPIIESRNESVRLSIISEGKESKSSKSSRKSSGVGNKESHAYDNGGYDSGKDNASSIGEFSRNNSNANSIRSTSRDSTQSLTVIHEQYCCCSRWTPCERILGASVAILATIIVILVIVIGFVASNKETSETFSWTI